MSHVNDSAAMPDWKSALREMSRQLLEQREDNMRKRAAKLNETDYQDTQPPFPEIINKSIGK